MEPVTDTKKAEVVAAWDDFQEIYRDGASKPELCLVIVDLEDLLFKIGKVKTAREAEQILLGSRITEPRDPAYLRLGKAIDALR